MQITLDIGKRISPEAWPWETVEDMYSDILEETGHSFEEMQELAPGYPPFDYRMHEKGLLRTDGNPGFQTATGRIELWSTQMCIRDRASSHGRRWRNRTGSFDSLTTASRCSP